MRKINAIVVHHTASPGALTDIAKVTSWHKQRGFSTIGYHFFINWDGSVEAGRPVARVGAHVKGNNANTIGICLSGNFEIEQPMPAQLQALETLLMQLFEDFPGAELKCHCDFISAATLCPGKNLRGLVWQMKEKFEK